MSKAIKPSRGKAIKARLRLLVKAGQAKPAAPLGPALGQAGVPIMNFCKDFNAKTADLKDDTPIPVRLTAYTDKTFEYTMKTPPTMFFIKKAAELEGGSQRPGHLAAGTISVKHIYEIAKIKQQGNEHIPLEGLCKSIVGTCRSMGITVVNRPPEA